MIPGSRVNTLGTSDPQEPKTLSYLGSHKMNGAGAANTFSAVSLGDAHANRAIIAVVQGVSGSVNSARINSVTIDGVAASEEIEFHEVFLTTGFNTAIYIANVPSGTTGDVVVTMSTASVSTVVAALYRVVGLNSLSANDTDSTTVDFGGIIDVNSTGLVVAGWSHLGDYDDYSPVAWVGLTKDEDVRSSSSDRLMSVASADELSEDHTYNFTSSPALTGGNSHGVAASFD